MATAATAKCLLVTGTPGVGKTTLIVRVLQSLKDAYPNLKVQGFYTREIREGNERIGFELVTLDGRTGPLASNRISRHQRIERKRRKNREPEIGHGEFFMQLFNGSESLKWPKVGRYRVDVASFESLALPELQIKEDTDLFVIDEVGKMELYSSFFFPAVLRVLESKIPLLASIPLPKSGIDIPGVARLRNHSESAVFTLNASNRDAVKEQIYSYLVDLLPKH